MGHDINTTDSSPALHRPWMQDLKPVANAPEIIAVVVGINKYTGTDKFTSLTGAVDDANAFEHFLKIRLKVPEKNIRSLRDEQATRDAILDSFIFLRDIETAPNQTAQMIFYYAGHGAQDEIPREWKDWRTPTGRIEMLCPSDIGATKSVTRNGETVQELVPGIPDRTISALLNEIAQKKGEHITVILDCCSSGGMSRGGSDENMYIPRQIFNAPSLNPSIDKRYLARHKVRKAGVSAEYAGRFRGSYVLLAACGQEQLAWEDPKTQSGLFTTNLLKILCGNELDTLTYRSLMDELKMPKRQTPHCEGKNVNRLLFGNKELSADTDFFHGRRAKDGRITIEGGALHGITVGSLFSVHKTSLKDTAFSPNPSQGYLVSTEVSAVSTTLTLSSTTPSFRPPTSFYCKMVHSPLARIALYSEQKEWLLKTLPPEKCNSLSAKIVESRDQCNLELIVDSREIHFKRHNDPVVISNIGALIHETIPSDDTETLYDVIKAAGHYTYHLNRVGSTGESDVRMEIHELESVPSEYFPHEQNVPVGENLIANEPATVVARSDRFLGVTIINNSNKVLYPYLYYFDPNDFSITEWHSPPLAAGAARTTASIELSIFTNIADIAGDIEKQQEETLLRIGVDGALVPGSSLSVGYGNSTADPWQFVVPKGHDRDIGFFRLFLSTRPSNFHSMKQTSPFMKTRGLSLMREDDAEQPDEWMVKTFTVIQERCEWE